jgi:hypothetical protein
MKSAVSHMTAVTRGRSRHVAGVACGLSVLWLSTRSAPLSVVEHAAVDWPVDRELPTKGANVTPITSRLPQARITFVEAATVTGPAVAREAQPGTADTITRVAYEYTPEVVVQPSASPAVLAGTIEVLPHAR